MADDEMEDGHEIRMAMPGDNPQADAVRGLSDVLIIAAEINGEFRGLDVGHAVSALIFAAWSLANVAGIQENFATITSRYVSDYEREKSGKPLH